MEKVKRPINLIAFATLAAESAKAEKRPVPAYRLVRPRTIVYAGLLVLVGLVMVTALALRSTVTLTVQQDRNPIFVQLSDGAIRNGYTIKISNKTRSALHYHLTIAGLDHALLMAAVDPKDAEPMLDMLVQPDNVGTYHVFVRLPVDRITDSRTAFDFVLADITNVPVARHDTLFSAPSR